MGTNMKMATENYKLTTGLKNKTWTKLQIKNHKIVHELKLTRPHITQKTRTHVLKILNTINTICG